MPALESRIVIIEAGDWPGIRANARAIYAALGDVVTCSRLRSLVVLYGTKNYGDMCPAELVAMLQARASQGRPLSRLAVKQWWTPTTGLLAVKAERERWDAAFGVIFPVARKFVEVVEIAEGADILPVMVRDVWKVDGAEDYSEIPPEDQPKYDPPPRWPTARVN